MPQQQPTADRATRISARTSGRRRAGSLLAVALIALLTGLGVHVAQSQAPSGHAAARTTVALGRDPWNSTGS
jgi:ferric-dicitrate binding protein FerR (iron transport regulator)